MKPEQVEPQQPLDEFEQQLARALRHVDAPEPMARLLLLAAEAEDKGSPRKARILAFPRPPLWMTGAIAAALVVGAFVGQDIHQRHQQQAAEQQFETAMRVTDHALHHTRSQLERAGITFGN